MPSSHPPVSEWGKETQTQASLAPTLPPHRLQGQLMLVSLTPAPSALSPPFPRALLPDPRGMGPGFLLSKEGTNAPNQHLDSPCFSLNRTGFCAKRKRWHLQGKMGGEASRLLDSLLACTEPPLSCTPLTRSVCSAPCRVQRHLLAN